MAQEGLHFLKQQAYLETVMFNYQPLLRKNNSEIDDDGESSSSSSNDDDDDEEIITPQVSHKPKSIWKTILSYTPHPRLIQVMKQQPLYRSNEITSKIFIDKVLLEEESLSEETKLKALLILQTPARSTFTQTVSELEQNHHYLQIKALEESREQTAGQKMVNITLEAMNKRQYQIKIEALKAISTTIITDAFNTMKKHFTVLHIPTDATNQDIAKQYRKLALQHHPDRHTTETQEEKDAANQTIIEINKAFNNLEPWRNYKSPSNMQ